MGRLLAPDLVERLREPPACLLEPEAAVEGVCVVAALGCRQEEQHATAPAGPRAPPGALSCSPISSRPAAPSATVALTFPTPPSRSGEAGTGVAARPTTVP